MAALAPEESATVYGSPVGVPTKLETGLKVITPAESTEYVPTPATVTVDAVQFGATSGVAADTSQSFTEVGSRVEPDVGVSTPVELVSRLML